ncbi:rRNA-processing protein fcf1, partial [Dimargaris xerosporica]
MDVQQGKAKRTRKFRETKRFLNTNDIRLKANQEKAEKEEEAKKKSEIVHSRPAASTMFFAYNTALGPPYHILLDTNFIYFSLRNKLEVVQAMMDCLYAKCIPCVTDCVIGELERLGRKYRLALR